jgi:hypothetical protein
MHLCKERSSLPTFVSHCQPEGLIVIAAAIIQQQVKHIGWRCAANSCKTKMRLLDVAEAFLLAGPSLTTADWHSWGSISILEGFAYKTLCGNHSQLYMGQA